MGDAIRCRILIEDQRMLRSSMQALIGLEVLNARERLRYAAESRRTNPRPWQDKLDQ